jgi:hypothetical protein
VSVGQARVQAHRALERLGGGIGQVLTQITDA